MYCHRQFYISLVLKLKLCIYETKIYYISRIVNIRTEYV